MWCHFRRSRYHCYKIGRLIGELASKGEKLWMSIVTLHARPVTLRFLQDVLVLYSITFSTQESLREVLNFEGLLQPTVSGRLLMRRLSQYQSQDLSRCSSRDARLARVFRSLTLEDGWIYSSKEPYGSLKVRLKQYTSEALPRRIASSSATGRWKSID